jgi:hypothetical protein
MPATFTPIATQTLTSAANAFDFQSISQSYTHLYVLCNFKSAAPGAGVDYYMRINGGAGSDYYTVIQSFTTGARSSSRRDNQSMAQLFYLQLGSTAGGVTTGQIWLPYYKDSSSKRNFQVRGGQANRETSSMSGFWNSSSAINRIQLFSDPTPSNAYFATGSSCTIFGLLEA